MSHTNSRAFPEREKRYALAESEVMALSSTALGVSRFWKVSVKNFRAPNRDGATMAALVFWSGRTDCYRPIIGLTATPYGFVVTKYDIVDFVANGVWPRSRHEKFEHALLSVEQAIKRIVEWAELGIEQSPLVGFPSPPYPHPMNSMPNH